MKLFNNNMLEVLPTFEDKSIDLTFTSPPFKEEDVDGEYWELYDQWMKEIFRVSKVAIIIHSATKMNTIIQKYPPKRVMVWGKGIIMASYRFNPIYVYELDGYKVNKAIWSDSFGIESILGKWKVAKYQDPDMLYETIIKMFKGMNTVLDPFMGSGTTGLACRKLEKEFIGIEMNKETFDIAEERLGKD